jgi:hypothetical protein
MNYEVNDNEEIANLLIEKLEEQTTQKVFTLRIIGEEEDALDAVVVFENKTILMGKITVGEQDGKLSVRIQGNFV